MRHSLEMLAKRAIGANKAVRLYIGTLAEMLEDADGCEIIRDEIRSTVEKHGRNWYVDRKVAEDGTEILDEAGMPASNAFWSLSFHNALREAAGHFKLSPAEIYVKAVRAHGENVGVKDIKQWIPQDDESSTSTKRDPIDEAIACLRANAEDPRVVAFLKG